MIKCVERSINFFPCRTPNWCLSHLAAPEPKRGVRLQAVAAIAKSVEKLRVVVTGEVCVVMLLSVFSCRVRSPVSASHRCSAPPGFRDCPSSSANRSPTLNYTHYIMRIGLQAEKEPKPEQCEKLARAWIERDAVAMLVHHMRVLEFEVRKTVSLIFCTLMQRDYVGFRSEYMPRHPELAHDLMAGYDDEIVALAVGPMIRSCLLSETLHRSLLYDDPGAPSDGMSRSLLCLMREFVHSPNFAVRTLRNFVDIVVGMNFVMLCGDGPSFLPFPVRGVVSAFFCRFGFAFLFVSFFGYHRFRRMRLRRCRAC